MSINVSKIYGASDDLIEIEGVINDEVSCYDDIKSIEASDGTKGKIWYNNDGNWQISISKKGDKFRELIEAVGEDYEHHSYFALNCSSYSDVLVLNDVEWIKIGRNKFYK